MEFDPTTKRFRLTYDTLGPDNRRYAGDLVTAVFVPSRHYPGGYKVTVEGAVVVSPPCAPQLLLHNLPAATTVSVELTPAAGRSCEAP
jgi:hypothetical protein